MTLKLVLIRKWFDMIQCGEKKEEYREITPYWCSRLLLIGDERKPQVWWEKIINENGLLYITKCMRSGLISFVPYEKITFYHGYKTDRDQFTINVINMRIDYGKKSWGAKKHKIYFVLCVK